MKLHNIQEVLEDSESFIGGLSLFISILIVVITLTVILLIISPAFTFGLIVFAAVCRVLFAIFKGE
jgi:hypothetical protein